MRRISVAMAGHLDGLAAVLGEERLLEGRLPGLELDDPAAGGRLDHGAIDPVTRIRRLSSRRTSLTPGRDANTDG